MDRPAGFIPAATVERLNLYRRGLLQIQATGRGQVFSHDLAALGQVTPAQVRRDLRTIEFNGSSVRGYQVSGLLSRISELLSPAANEGACLVGVGQLGRVLLSYLTGHSQSVRLVAAFDIDAAVIGRVLHGVRCYAMAELCDVTGRFGVRVGVLTVPGAAAQSAAQALADAGVTGILNFAPVRLLPPRGVYVENVDIATLLAKAALFARLAAGGMEVRG